MQRNGASVNAAVSRRAVLVGVVRPAWWGLRRLRSPQWSTGRGITASPSDASEHVALDVTASNRKALSGIERSRRFAGWIDGRNER
jgi:hypothetical protein